MVSNRVATLLQRSLTTYYRARVIVNIFRGISFAAEHTEASFRGILPSFPAFVIVLSASRYNNAITSDCATLSARYPFRVSDPQWPESGLLITRWNEIPSWGHELEKFHRRGIPTSGNISRNVSWCTSRGCRHASRNVLGRGGEEPTLLLSFPRSFVGSITTRRFRNQESAYRKMHRLLNISGKSSRDVSNGRNMLRSQRGRSRGVILSAWGVC